MLEATLDVFDLFTDVSEALDQLRVLCWINVSKSKLTIRVVLAERVDKALITDEESEVVATGDALNLGLLTEWHAHW